MTFKEKRAWLRYRKVEDANIVAMHKLSWKVAKIVGETNGTSEGNWKVIEKLEKLANKYPIRLVRVDDSYHSSSELVFVPHESKEGYWGTTVWFIPQCAEGMPSAFFLYEGHALGLQEAVDKVVRKHKERPMEEEEWPEIIENAKP